MYELMNNGDLNMYYGGTFMKHEERVVYVSNIQGERSRSVAETSEGRIPMSELSVFFPVTQVLQMSAPEPVVILQASSRNYKKSYRDGRSSHTRLCNAFTASLTANLPTLQEAAEMLNGRHHAHRVFGLNGKFCLKKYPEYSVPVVYYLNDFLGYYNVEENKVVVASGTNQVLLERLVKNCGGADVIIES